MTKLDARAVLDASASSIMKIHESIAARSDLSTDAHNVEVRLEQGVITLRGQVSSVQDRDAIDSIATGIAGAPRVDNQLKVKAQALASDDTVAPAALASRAKR